MVEYLKNLEAEVLYILHAVFFCKLNSILETNEFNFRNNIKEERPWRINSGSYDIEISYAKLSGLDMPTAVYGFTKYDYTCHKCGGFGDCWI